MHFMSCINSFSPQWLEAAIRRYCRDDLGEWQTAGEKHLLMGSSIQYDIFVMVFLRTSLFASSLCLPACSCTTPAPREATLAGQADELADIVRTLSMGSEYNIYGKRRYEILDAGDCFLHLLCLIQNVFVMLLDSESLTWIYLVWLHQLYSNACQVASEYW